MPTRRRCAAEYSREKFSPALRMRQVTNEHRLNIYSPENDLIITFGQIVLHIGHGDLYAMTTFSVAVTLSLNIVIGTCFMYKPVIFIYFTEIRLKPLRSRPIAIIHMGAAHKLNISTASLSKK